MENVFLTQEQIKTLIVLVNTAKFDGKHAYDVCALLNALKGGLTIAENQD